MFLIREAAPDDVPGILRVAKYLNSVNLPADRDKIETLVKTSVKAFAGDLSKEESEYWFVLVDTDKSLIIGTSMVHGQHGSRRAPHVYLRVGEHETYSETLDKYFVHQTLQIGYDYNGPTEIGGLILDPEYRGHAAKLGKFLSMVRFMYIAAHRDRFRGEILSELMPPLEEDGTSRLWKHLGRRFTGLTYSEADHLSKDNKEFIRTLFPHGEIYTSLFPEVVQDAIGQVGPASKGAEKLLTKIGFSFCHEIDPFDGGPHFKAKTEDAVRFFSQLEVGKDREGTQWAAVGREKAGSFRASVTSKAVIEQGYVSFSEAVREELGLEQGDVVWVFSSPG